jgi:integrase
VWTPEQLRAFLNHVREDRLYVAWLLVATTGLRRAELAGLRWVDVDLDAGRVSPRRPRVVVDYAVVESDAKTPKGRRSLALDPVTLATLKAHLAAGVPPKVISQRLGHATIAITMDTYSHVIPGLDEQAAETVARLILGDVEPAAELSANKTASNRPLVDCMTKEVKRRSPAQRGVGGGLETPRPIRALGGVLKVAR